MISFAVFLVSLLSSMDSAFYSSTPNPFSPLFGFLFLLFIGLSLVFLLLGVSLVLLRQRSSRLHKSP
jgi:hypothetical protein